MLDFKLVRDKTTGEAWIETSLNGKPLLTTPQLNKGTAFSERERHEFGLTGKLPTRIETLEEQVARSYHQFTSHLTQLKRNIYLHDLHDSNQVLFYALARTNLNEILPTIYTPIVGTRVKEFSHEFRKARGLYITLQDINDIDEILDNRSNPEIDLIVVTDGESVLGIGDQGVGAMDIPVAKLMVYSLSGATDPNRTLPILLDVGTNNHSLLEDPLYLGVRHQRVSGKPYDEFIAAFIKSVKHKFPKVFLHWEDFGRENAHRNLNFYRDEICSFNDDIQGTGAVSLAALKAAIKINHSTFADQRIIIFGAGTAGTGIAEQIVAAMRRQGLNEAETRKRFWLIDKPGLITEATAEVTLEQKYFARSLSEIQNWKVTDTSHISLLDVINHIKPTILIGTSGRAGAFNQEIIRAMAQHVERPIIMPLSNPTDYAEAAPEDLLQWTDGKALIATGSPFPDVNYNGNNYKIAQCNNSLVFPGIGWGVMAVKASKLTDDMLWLASEILAENSPILQDPTAPLLPLLDCMESIARKIAFAIAKNALENGLAGETQTPLEQLIDQQAWYPHYYPFRRIYKK